MNTWLALDALIWPAIILSVGRRDDRRTMVFAKCVMMAFLVPPAIYALGWIALPAWGVGAVRACGG